MTRRVPELCFAVVIAAMVQSGIGPRYRVLWAAELVLVVLWLPVLVWAHRRVHFSNVAAVTTTTFMLLHLLGAHNGYNEFPLFADWREWGWSRNHYDRLVHLAYGLLIVVPVRGQLEQRRGAAVPRRAGGRVGRAQGHGARHRRRGARDVVGRAATGSTLTRERVR